MELRSFLRLDRLKQANRYLDIYVKGTTGKKGQNLEECFMIFEGKI